MTEANFRKAVYATVYAIAFVYYLGYYLRSLLPQHLTNKYLVSLPSTMVGKYSDTYTLTLLTVKNTCVAISSWGLNVIAEFSPHKVWETATNLASEYVTRWRQRDH